MPDQIGCFEDLSDFVQHRMRLSHVYQPVMLMRLLGNGGRCHEAEIATGFLSHDPTQVEYYTRVCNNMVGRVLRGHGIVTRDRKTKVYCLVGYDSPTQEQRQTLVGLCNARLRDFVAKRGKQVFVHRRTSTRNISGTLKYEVLKRAMTSRLLCSFPRRPACSSRFRRSLRKFSS